MGTHGRRDGTGGDRVTGAETGNYWRRLCCCLVLSNEIITCFLSAAHGYPITKHTDNFPTFQSAPQGDVAAQGGLGTFAALQCQRLQLLYNTAPTSHCGKIPLNLTLLSLASKEMSATLVQGGLIVQHPCGRARK